MSILTYVNYDLPLDPNHYLYRICLNCDLKFMAIHGHCKHCCQKCHDDHHNKSRREKIAPKDLIVQTNQAPSAEPAPAPKLELKIDAYNRAIELFSKLEIDPFKGTCYNLSNLIQVGFNPLSCYLQKLPTYNEDSNYMEFGRFKVFFISSWEVLIVDVEKQKKYIQDKLNNNVLAYLFPSLYIK